MTTETLTHGDSPTAARGALQDILRSRVVAWLLSPLVAILPWWITILGVMALARWQYPGPGESADVSLLVGATAWLLFAGLLWALVTAWSSTGPVVAGMCSLLTGWLLNTGAAQNRVWDLTYVLDLDTSQEVRWLAQPVFFLLVGSLLVAAGLGAAGARRSSRWTRLQG